MNENFKALLMYRLEQATESLESAELLYEHEKYRSAISRAYYAMFYSVLALLANQPSTTSKHSGVISRFDRDFVKTGHFDKVFSKWLHDAFDLRQRADYREMFDIDAPRTDEVIQHAKKFVTEIRTKVEV
jgi:uncharacterized protein (UPF0332 family)